MGNNLNADIEQRLVIFTSVQSSHTIFPVLELNPSLPTRYTAVRVLQC